MSVNKIVTKVDGVENKTIDFNDLKAGLAAGSHTITVEAFNGSTLISTQTKNITIAVVAAYESETTAYVNAIGIPNDGTATIYPSLTGSGFWTLTNNLVSGLKSNGLLTKLFYYYPLCGDTANKQKFNLKDINTFPVTWFGGWIFDNKGALGNGANTYADTGFVPSANKDVNSNGLSVVIGTDNTPIKADVAEMGCFNGTTQASLIQVYPSSGTQTLGGRMNSQITSVANVGSQGVYSEVKTNASTSAIYKNSVSKATGSGGGRLPTFTTFIGNMSFNDNAPYNIGYSNQRFQGALEHTGLTLTEVQALHSLIDTFEAGIGRKTW